jgi:rhamnose transport system permease protein
MSLLRSLFARREALLLAAMLALLVGVAARFPKFASPTSLANVFHDTSILIILALGQMAVILTKSIDLSVAANLAFTGMTVAMLNHAFPELPIMLLMVIAALMGLVLGAINGLLVWRLDIPPIVVTLGTLTIYRGLAFVESGGAWVNAHEMSASFLEVPRTVLLGLPVLSWLAILTIGLAVIVFNRTPVGRAFFATGGNAVAAIYTGIDVGRTRFFAFCLSGMLSGLSGYLWVSRYAVAYVDVAGGFELNVVAACVIGGVSIAGGIGSVAGTVLGALFLGLIMNALPVIGVSPFWQMAISGAVIIAAVTINARAEHTAGRNILRRKEIAL